MFRSVTGKPNSQGDKQNIFKLRCIKIRTSMSSSSCSKATEVTPLRKNRQKTVCDTFLDGLAFSTRVKAEPKSNAQVIADWLAVYPNPS